MRVRVGINGMGRIGRAVLRGISSGTSHAPSRSGERLERIH